MVDKKVLMILVDCSQTADTQLKKLVYLYLICYAKNNPYLTILAVNTFVKDAAGSNPLVRTLSVRTMGCIRVDRIIEYLCEPLRRFLKDEDPLNPTVVANAIAALSEISEDSAGVMAITITKSVLQKLLAALNECNEWGQVFVIDALAGYMPADFARQKGLLNG
ncbi:unnamed protein product [Peronospora effusa]|nr:unnamed protein product [Peronospora effusa]